MLNVVLKSLFKSPVKNDGLVLEKFSDQIVLEKLFSFLNLLILQIEPNRNFAERYQQILSLSPIEKEVESIKLYKKYEEFLVDNKPPIVQREYSIEELRKEVQAIINVQELSDAFQLFFLTDTQKAIVLFKLVIPIVAQYMLSLIGSTSWKEMIEQITRGTILDGAYVIKDTVKFQEASLERLRAMDTKEVLAITSTFFDSMYSHVNAVLGKEQSQQPFMSLYKFVKIAFPYDVTSLLLDILPSEIFEEERIEIKSKKELERIIQEKTSQIENAKKLLEQKVDEFQRQNQKLEDIKKSMLNLLEDLQEEKENAEEGKARDDALLNSIGDGMIASDKYNRIILMNEQAAVLLGYKREELIGRELAEVIGLVYETGEPVPIPKRPAYLALASGRKVSLSATSSEVIYYVRKDKTRFPAVITSTPVVVNRTISGTITIFKDATREKEIDRMKTEFISLASHQLRTPLSAIKWFGEMLLAGDAGILTSEQHEFVNNISISTERMIELVDSLLNISRIESGRIVIDPQPTDMKDLVEGIISELGVKIQEKHQNVVLSITGELPKINVDQRLIRQVYLNLLTNAIKYSPDGSEVSVSLSLQGEDILSQVADHGYGIPKEAQTKIFDKFYRAENAVKVETDGTGLGLYLVKAIVESSHGRIWFESEEGKGTIFSFTLPAAGMTAKAGEVTLA